MPGMSSMETTPVATGWVRWHRHPPNAVAAVRADAASAEAWTIFWKEQRPDSRCWDNAPPDMRRVMDSHWRALASTLPPATTVIDIGCGAGAVGRELLSWRPDLSITGIDIAAILLSIEPRILLLPDTPMESLPFADRSFGAVVSQFGYEYGRTAEAAREIARVLVPGAPLSFLVHHSESPIVADSHLLLRALDQLVGAPFREAFLSGQAALLQQRLAALCRDCPGQRIVEQAARGLCVRINGPEVERAAVWNAVVSALGPERFMLRSLTASCVAPDKLTNWLEPLTEGFAIHSPSILRMGGGKPLAWKIEGRRR
jgi:SAM-dependent methyltransferase